MDPISPSLLSGLAGRAMVNAAGPFVSSVQAARGFNARESVEDSASDADEYLISAIATLRKQLPDAELAGVGSFLRSPAADVIVRAIFVSMVSDRLNTTRGTLAQDLQSVLELGYQYGADAAAIMASALIRLIESVLERSLQELRKKSRSEYEKLADRLKREAESGYASSLLERARLVNGVTPEALTLALGFLADYRSLLHSQSSEIIPAYFETQRRLSIAGSYIEPRLCRFSVDSYHDVGSPVGLNVFRHSIYRTVVLGDPGGGKSTLAQKLAYEMTFSGIDSRATPIQTPFIVTIRDFERNRYARGGSIVVFLEHSIRDALQINPPDQSLAYLLASGAAVVIFDGLDELLSLKSRRNMCEAIESFALRYPQSPIIVTSRKMGYAEAPVRPELFDVWRLLEFNDDDVRRYVDAWFSRDARLSSKEQVDLAAAFMDESRDVRDLRVNPLMLGLLCNIYRGVRSIPRSRSDLYRQCAEMLFERWDAGRGIASDRILKADAKAVLQHVALWALTDPTILGGDIPERALKRKMADYLLKRSSSADVAFDAADRLLDMWKGRAWVLLDVGAKDGESVYRFTHRTFLEYFSAVELVRQNPSPQSLWIALAEKICSGGWTIVAQIAIQALDQFYQDAGDEVVRIALSYCSHSDTRRRDRRAVLDFLASGLEGFQPSVLSVRMLARATAELALINYPIARTKSAELDKDETSWSYLTPLLTLLGQATDLREMAATEMLDYFSGVFTGTDSTYRERSGVFVLSGRELAERYARIGWTATGSSSVRFAILGFARQSFWLPILGWRAGLLQLGEAMEASSPDAIVCTSTPFDQNRGLRSSRSMAEAYVDDTVNYRSVPSEAMPFVHQAEVAPQGLFDADWFGLGSTLYSDARRRFDTMSSQCNTRGVEQLSEPQLFAAMILLAYIAEAEDWPMYEPGDGLHPPLDLGSLNHYLPVLVARRVPGEHVRAMAALASGPLRRSGQELLQHWALREIDLRRYGLDRSGNISAESRPSGE